MLQNTFDDKAGTWDQNPANTERAKAIARLLETGIPIGSGKVALEFGAGTGLLSFLLKDRFREITLMDSSREMIRMIEQKITARGIENMKPVFHDLEKEPFPSQFDVIYTQMVFHHVTSIDQVLDRFYSMMTGGGYLAIADLYPEDGSFHGEGFTGHKGFNVERLSITLLNHGFKNIHVQPCFIIRKAAENGDQKEYPVFLMTANR